MKEEQLLVRCSAHCLILEAIKSTARELEVEIKKKNGGSSSSSNPHQRRLLLLVEVPIGVLESFLHAKRQGEAASRKTKRMEHLAFEHGRRSGPDI